MRTWMFFAAVTIVTQLGCTHLELQNSTCRQAGTLTDLQYQQILNNLAMLSVNPDAIPSHVKLTGGSIQVTDLGAGGVNGSWGATMGSIQNLYTPNLNAQRTRLGQWNVEPVIDSGELETLQLVYKKQLCPDDEAIDKEIRFQIWSLIVAFRFQPANSLTLMTIMKDAIDEWGIQKTLKKSNDVAKDNIVRERINNASVILNRAQDSLKNLVQLQNMEYYPVFPGNTPDEQEQALLCFTNYLALPGSDHEFNQLPPGAEYEYVKQFDEYVASFLSLVRAAKTELSDIAPESDTDDLQNVRQWLTFMDNETQLRNSLIRLNPWRRRKLDRAKNYRYLDISKIVNGLAQTSYDQTNNISTHHDVLEFLDLYGSHRYFIAQTNATLMPRNPGLADQAQTKADTLVEMVDPDDAEESTLWFFCGSKREVPKCACYVGHYKGCGQDRYVWVMPDGVKQLSKFSLAIQSLLAVDSQDSSSGNITFSPGLK